MKQIPLLLIQVILWAVAALVSALVYYGLEMPLRWAVPVGIVAAFVLAPFLALAKLKQRGKPGRHKPLQPPTTPPA
jgi:hypothetical protein